MKFQIELTAWVALTGKVGDIRWPDRVWIEIDGDMLRVYSGAHFCVESIKLAPNVRLCELQHRGVVGDWSRVDTLLGMLTDVAKEFGKNGLPVEDEAALTRMRELIFAAVTAGE